jgi:hypothetical protein
MSIARIGPSVALIAALVFAPAALAGDEAVCQKLLQEKSAPVVSVKLVLTVKISRGGQAQEQEINQTASGVIVDPSGLVLVPGSAFDPAIGIPRRMRSFMDIQATPSNIRVVFPGDTREYPAILGAKDSKLGLGFVMIKDLGDKKLEAASLEGEAEPQVGATLYSVTRMDQGFDHAPAIRRVLVSGSVTKPRTMWALQGAGDDDVGMPLYDATGAVAGVVVSQSGVGEESETHAFLLPMKVAAPTVAGALKRSQEELERIRDEEAEKAAPKDGEEKKDGDAPKDGDEKKEGDDGKKDGGEPSDGGR